MKLPQIISIIFVILLWTSALEAQQPLSLQQRRQLFMAGVQAYEDQEYQLAFVGFEMLRGQYPELEDYVTYFLAFSALKLHDEPKAFTLFQEFLTNYLSHPLRYDVHLHIGHLLFAKQEYTAARDVYRQLLKHPDIEPPGEIDYRLGNVFLALNKPDEAIFSFNQVVYYYPKHPDRQEAQRQLEALLAKHPNLRPKWAEGQLLRSARAFFNANQYGTAITQYEAVKTEFPRSSKMEEVEFRLVELYFRTGQIQKANAALQTLTKHPNKNIAAHALHTIGVRQWNDERNTDAKATMEQILKQYKQSDWADDAYYVIARIYQSQHAYHDAAQWYEDLYAHNARSSFAEEALWRAGWCYYLDGQYGQAVRVFSKASARFSKGIFTEDTLYWLGRTQEQQQQPAEAVANYQRLLRYNPTSYYARLARGRLHHLNVEPPTPQAIKPEPEMARLLEQLRQILPSKNYTQIRPHLEKIFELQALGLWRYAGREAEWLVGLVGDGSEIFDRPENRDNALILRYIISRVYAAADRYQQTIQWALQLEAVLENKEERRYTYKLDTFPYPLDTLIYPRGFWDVITTYAAAGKLDPFLVAAMIRRESAYDPDAESYAGALGLMQVMPLTGWRTAYKLQFDTFYAEDLYDPALNIELGTAYLADLLEQFDGNVYRALAAYNAGPSATRKWWPATGTVEQEVLIENITYRETRSYLKRVLRDYDQYRRIYGNFQD